MSPVTGVAQLTQSEVWLMSEHMRALALCKKKCDTYVNMCQDQQLKQLISHCRDVCQDHMNRIQSMLQGAGVTLPQG